MQTIYIYGSEYDGILNEQRRLYQKLPAIDSSIYDRRALVAENCPSLYFGSVYEPTIQANEIYFFTNPSSPYVTGATSVNDLYLGIVDNPSYGVVPEYGVVYQVQNRRRSGGWVVDTNYQIVFYQHIWERFYEFSPVVTTPTTGTYIYHSDTTYQSIIPNPTDCVLGVNDIHVEIRAPHYSHYVRTYGPSGQGWTQESRCYYSEILINGQSSTKTINGNTTTFTNRSNITTFPLEIKIKAGNLNIAPWVYYDTFQLEPARWMTVKPVKLDNNIVRYRRETYNAFEYTGRATFDYSTTSNHKLKWSNGEDAFTNPITIKVTLTDPAKSYSRTITVLNGSVNQTSPYDIVARFSSSLYPYEWQSSTSKITTVISDNFSSYTFSKNGPFDDPPLFYFTHDKVQCNIPVCHYTNWNSNFTSPIYINGVDFATYIHNVKYSS